MISMPDLKTALLDLLYEIRDDDLRLIIGGGYGIYLKREHLRTTGERTLFAEWPEARSTNDLDLFLRPELLIAEERLKPLANALTQLGYDPVEGAEKYQFTKPGPTGGREGSLKIDLLTGPRRCFEGTGVRFDERRVRPRPSVGIHAHPVDEALTLENDLMPVCFEGTTSKGKMHEATVFLPHPFTYAMMKLFAFRDRFNDENKEFGRYHALDLYVVLAMATEVEWKTAQTLSRERHQANEYVEATRIVEQYFGTQTSGGVLRLRESPYWRPELQIVDFLSALRELFPTKTTNGGV